MNTVLLWVGIIIILLWPISWIIASITCRNIDKNGKESYLGMCAISLMYIAYGGMFSLLGVVLVIVGAVIPSGGSSNSNTKTRSNNQELEGGRRRK
jgi:uncharacterized membrane protein